MNPAELKELDRLNENYKKSAKRLLLMTEFRDTTFDMVIELEFLSKQLLYKKESDEVYLKQYKEIHLSGKEAIQYRVELERNGEFAARVRYRVSKENEILHGFSVNIHDGFGDNEVIDLVALHFKDIYENQYKGYHFHYKFGIPKFEEMVKRKVRQGKLPREIVEKRL
ncbi:hypothetical protein ABET51_06695 [Metabacillus fastidiosus]|uniref:hypothetical protein n=1 Tax=Metabacillus fastidiosus TaxID=1458 RepID=UPI003D2E5405